MVPQAVRNPKSTVDFALDESNYDSSPEPADATYYSKCGDDDILGVQKIQTQFCEEVARIF